MLIDIYKIMQRHEALYTDDGIYYDSLLLKEITKYFDGKNICYATTYEPPLVICAFTDKKRGTKIQIIHWNVMEEELGEKER